MNTSKNTSRVMWKLLSVVVVVLLVVVGALGNPEQSSVAVAATEAATEDASAVNVASCQTRNSGAVSIVDEYALMGAAEGEIKIGVAIDLSPVSEISQVQLQGLLLAQEQINDNHGIDNRKVALLIEDMAQDANEASTEADKPKDDTAKDSQASTEKKDKIEAVFEKWQTEDKVLAIISAISGERAERLYTLAQDANIPVLSLAQSGQVKDKSFVFSMSLPESALISQTVEVAATKFGVKRVVVVYEAETQAVHDLFKSELESKGVAVAESLLLDKEEKDVAGKLKQLEAAKPDAIVLALPPQIIDQVVMTTREQQLTQMIIGVTGLMAKNIEGTIVGGDWSCATANPENTSFIRAYMMHWSQAPAPDAAKAYTAMYVLVNAIRRSQSTDPKLIRDGLASTSQLPTVLGLLSFGDSGQVEHSLYVQAIKGGSLSLAEVAPVGQ